MGAEMLCRRRASCPCTGAFGQRQERTLGRHTCGQRIGNLHRLTATSIAMQLAGDQTLRILHNGVGRH